jgi:hypothetical protein
MRYPANGEICRRLDPVGGNRLVELFRRCIARRAWRLVHGRSEQAPASLGQHVETVCHRLGEGPARDIRIGRPVKGNHRAPARLEANGRDACPMRDLVCPGPRGVDEAGCLETSLIRADFPEIALMRDPCDPCAGDQHSAMRAQVSKVALEHRVGVEPQRPSIKDRARRMLWPGLQDRHHLLDFLAFVDFKVASEALMHRHQRREFAFLRLARNVQCRVHGRDRRSRCALHLAKARQAPRGQRAHDAIAKAEMRERHAAARGVVARRAFRLQHRHAHRARQPRGEREPRDPAADHHRIEGLRVPIAHHRSRRRTRYRHCAPAITALALARDAARAPKSGE